MKYVQPSGVSVSPKRHKRELSPSSRKISGERGSPSLYGEDTVSASSASAGTHQQGGGFLNLGATYEEKKMRLRKQQHAEMRAQMEDQKAANPRLKRRGDDHLSISPERGPVPQANARSPLPDERITVRRYDVESPSVRTASELPRGKVRAEEISAGGDCIPFEATKLTGRPCEFSSCKLRTFAEPGRGQSGV